MHKQIDQYLTCGVDVSAKKLHFHWMYAISFTLPL
jgi:hypothetical protein